MSVEILLASFQGLPYLDEQIRSIQVQTFTDFRLIIRDDGSKDGTFKRLEAFARGDSRIVLLPQEPSARPLGAKNNFAELMRHSKADHVFFADQDDIWKPEKLTVMLKRLLNLEESHGSATAFLLHSDLEVIDEKGSLIAPSFWRLTGLNPASSKSFSRILMQNPVTGCGMLVNRALIQRAKELPAEALMHDGWLALIAAAFGTVDIMPEALVQYRQHSRNVVGAKPLSFISGLKKGFSRDHTPYLKQAQAFQRLFQTELSVEVKEILKAYLALPHQSFFESRKSIFKHKLYKQGALRNLLHLTTTYE